MRVPKYRKNPDGRAFVEYQTKRTYLGVWGSPESKQAYGKFLATIFQSPASFVELATAAVMEVANHSN